MVYYVRLFGHSNIYVKKSLSLLNIENIMNEMDYTGVRVYINAFLESLNIPFSIDISVGDVITPKEIAFNYNLMLENRCINILTYNIETIIAEKLQTILIRGILNTRMRDYYDIYMLSLRFKHSINYTDLANAFYSTCSKRNTPFTKEQRLEIINNVGKDEEMNNLWNAYALKYQFASNIEFAKVLESIKNINELL